MASVGFLVVSQLASVARGIVALVQPLAPEVAFQPCACAAASLTASVETIEEAANELSAQVDDSVHILIVADVGSSAMAVQEFLAEQDNRRFLRARGPFLEGLVAGAVAAQQGADVRETLRSFAAAAKFFAEDPPLLENKNDELDGAIETEIDVTAPTGLAARPAALIARLVSDENAVVTINGIDAASVLGLMRLHLAAGDSATIRVEGEGAERVMDRVKAILTADD